MTEYEQRFGMFVNNGSAEDNLYVPSAIERACLPYQPSKQEIFQKALEAITAPLDNYSFIDIGAGKGWILILASQYPFRKVIGVEYSRSLVEVARENYTAYGLQGRKCKQIECLHADATTFDYPEDSALIYVFNSFQGKMMDRFVENLERSLQRRPRDLWIIYVNAWEHRKFARSREFEKVAMNLDFSIFRSTRR